MQQTIVAYNSISKKWWLCTWLKTDIKHAEIWINLIYRKNKPSCVKSVNQSFDVLRMPNHGATSSFIENNFDRLYFMTLYYT